MPPAGNSSPLTRESLTTWNRPTARRALTFFPNSSATSPTGDDRHVSTGGCERCPSHSRIRSLATFAEHSWWFTQLRLASNGRLDVIVELDEQAPAASFGQADECLLWAIEAAPCRRREAVEREHLELSNGVWRAGGAELTPDELMSRLD